MNTNKNTVVEKGTYMCFLVEGGASCGRIDGYNGVTGEYRIFSNGETLNIHRDDLDGELDEIDLADYFAKQMMNDMVNEDEVDAAIETEKVYLNDILQSRAWLVVNKENNGSE